MRATSNSTPLTPPTVIGSGLPVLREGWCWNQAARSSGSSPNCSVPDSVGLKTSWTLVKANPAGSPYSSSKTSEASGGDVSQPLPTLKEAEGLNSSVRYSPGRSSWCCSGRGRALASSSCPPASPPPLQALSAKTRSVTSSPTTGSAAHALRLLTLVMPIFPSAHSYGRERALSATPPRVCCCMGSIFLYRGKRITQIDYLCCSLGITCG